VALRNRASGTAGVKGLNIVLDVRVRKKCKDVTSIRALGIQADNRHVLVYTSGQNFIRYNAGAPECDAVARDVKKDVIRPQNYAT
jgi:hypothetical protein